MSEAKKQRILLTTPEGGRASFPNLFKRVIYDEADKRMVESEEKNAKYRFTVLVPKSEKKFKADLDTMLDAAVREKFPKGRPASELFNWPVIDGDKKNLEIENEDGDAVEAYKGHWIIQCSSKKKPRVFDDQTKPILDPEEIYPGCFARARISAWSYNVSKKVQGVVVELSMVQKTGEGELIGGHHEDENEVFSKVGDTDTETEETETDSSDLW